MNLSALTQTGRSPSAATASHTAAAVPGVCSVRSSALRALLQQLIAHSAASRGMALALETLMNSGSPVFAQARAAMVDALASIMAAAIAAGEIRADVTPHTVFRAMGGVCTSHELPDWEVEAQAVLRLLLDGLRPVAPSQ